MEASPEPWTGLGELTVPLLLQDFWTLSSSIRWLLDDETLPELLQLHHVSN